MRTARSDLSKIGQVSRIGRIGRIRRLGGVAEIVTLAGAIAAAIHDGDTVAMEGFTHLIPHAAGREVIRQRRRGLTLVRMTPDVIYDQLIGAGCARKLVFSWGGNPGVGSLHRFRDAYENGWRRPPGAPGERPRERLARPAGDRGAQPRRDGQPVRGGRVGAALRRAARLPRHRAGRADPERDRHHLPVHGGGADPGGGAAPGRDRHPRPAGRPGRQRPAVGHHRGAEGGGPGRPAVGGHGGGDRRPAGPAAGRGGAAGLDGDLRGMGAGRRPSVLRAGLLGPRQRLLRGLGRHQPGPRGLHPVARHRDPRGGAGPVSDCAARDDTAGEYTADEMMTITPARTLAAGMTCFVGIGLPSAAANLARATHAPDLVLIYESGTIGAKPGALPLSIGDGILAQTADAVVSVPEIFNYWLQPGRIDVGFLGAAQLDRFGNINTTVIGPSYDRPVVRLPGAGGAPEIAAACKEVVVVLRQSRRTFA